MASREELPCEIDGALLDSAERERSDAGNYFIEACAHLVNVLHVDRKLRTSPLHDRVLTLIAYWNAAPSERDRTRAEAMAVELERFAAVGKTLWYLRHGDDPQLRRELARLADSPDLLVGNQYLFYVAGTLASRGYEVEFVPERGAAAAKTPDLRAARDGKSWWIEANAKQPKRAVDTTQKIWEVVRDIVGEKKQKFVDTTYSPGVIVADISTIQYEVNETSLPPELKNRADIVQWRGPHPQDGFIYRIYDDPDWHSQPENRGNVVAYLIEEFANIDRAKYHVDQCLITIARRSGRDGRATTFPKQHLLVVDRSCEGSALIDVARDVYVVDTAAGLQR